MLSTGKSRDRDRGEMFLSRIGERCVGEMLTFRTVENCECEGG